MRALALLLILFLPACGDAGEPEIPGPSVTPQAIGYPDIEANGLHGASCAYASGTSMAPIAIAFADEAVMKIAGQIHRFRLDAESEGSQPGENSRYLGEDRVLLLTTVAGSASSDEESAKYAGTVRLLDGAGAVLYETSGTAQCGS